MAAVSVRGRHPLRFAALVVAGALVVLAVAAAILFLWFDRYAPLRADGAFAPGPGLGADVEPVTGSGGKPVFIPAYRAGRPFDTAFTVHNAGRFAIEVEGLEEPAGTSELEAVGLLATESASANADPGRLRPFAKLRLARGDTAILVVRWRLDCAKSTQEISADTVPLRYSYLSIFTRTERIRLPFAVTLRCSGGPPALR